MTLILINFIAIFILWRRYKAWSFLPLAVTLIFLPLFTFADNTGSQIGTHNKPCDPNSYFNETNRQELTSIAENLLRDSNENNTEKIKKRLNEYDMHIRNVDICANVVELGYFRGRTLHVYLFAKNELPEIYSVEPVITECDIGSWGEVASLIKTENDPSKYDRASIVFEPEIVYPFLVSNLDVAFIEKLKNMPPKEDLQSSLDKNKDLPIMQAIDKHNSDYDNLIANQLTPKEKSEVIKVLNKYCQSPNQLVENENVRFVKSFLPTEKRALEFCKTGSLSSSFEVNKHLERLVSKGVIKIKDDEGHLQVKDNLTKSEQLEIKWLQIEMMDFVFGNIVKTTQYSSGGKTRLSDKWYFSIRR